MTLQRILDLAGTESTAVCRSKLAAFRSFLLLHGTVRSWLWLASGPEVAPLWIAGTASALTICLGLSFRPDLRHLAPRIALPVLAAQLSWTFPLTDNHFYLELLGMVLLALADRDARADEQLVSQALLWLTAIVLFQTGVQKILYGHYLRGDFLAFMLGLGGRFADVFQWIVPGEEVARLQAIDPMRTGAGPYRVDAWPLVLLSNGVVLAELALPVLLIAGTTRRWAAWIAIAFVLAIQLGARELGFAFLFTSFLLLFVPTDLNRRALPVFALLYVLVVGAALGWWPGAGLMKPGFL